jgi:fumarylacetoacetase
MLTGGTRRRVLTAIDHTHDSAASSWVDGADDHADFPVQNLPLGIFSGADEPQRIGTAIGDQVLDLAALAQAGHLPKNLTEVLQSSTLNDLFALAPQDRTALRRTLFLMLTSRVWYSRVRPHLVPVADCQMHLPFQIGDYTDFYTGIHHATNIGKQFRPDNPLLPNYKHVPIGYHGRASSVRVSGYPVIRPKGQLKSPDDGEPSFKPCRRLDYELELGVWIAGANVLGEQVTIAEAQDRIGGYCLLNDWSARDIQAWEYQPLGPFLAKSFLTTISPWVVTREALFPFAAPQQARPQGDPQPLPYLLDPADQEEGALAISLEVHLATAAMRAAGQPAQQLSRVSAEQMYWTTAQMLTHHASNGCNLMPGDLLGTGTISRPDRDSLGSLMELSQGGQVPITLANGESRFFLEDGDEVILRAVAEKAGLRSIGFGPCRGIVTESVQ